MSAPPFMQMYWSDYFGDTRHLTCEQHGAYLQLLGSMWLAGGSLPNDPRKLAKITGCTSSRWAKIADDVLAFFSAEDGALTHKRIGIELEKAREKSIKRAEAGSLGGTAKALKTHKPEVAIATVLPKHLPEPEPEREEPPSTLTGGSTPKGAKRPRIARARFCPADWKPTEGDLGVGAGEGFTPGEIERELAKFRDYEFRDPHSDWSKTFRTWLRRASERKPRLIHERPHHDAKFTAKQANLATFERGADLAARLHGKP